MSWNWTLKWLGILKNKRDEFFESASMSSGA